MLPRNRVSRLDSAALFLCLAVLGVLVVYPVSRSLVNAISGWQNDAVLSGAGWNALRNTLLISFASVVTAGLFGTSLAFLVTRFDFPGQRLIASLVYMPFALPPLVGVLSFYYLIGRDGLIPRAAEYWFGARGISLEGPAAILLIHTYSFYVFFYAMVSAALESMDPSQVEAARTLGATRWRVFHAILFPTLRPALMGASLLAFMSSAASFSAPYFFGQHFPMLSVAIFNERSQFHHEAALSLTLVLAMVSLLGVLLFRSRHAACGPATKGVRVAPRKRFARTAMTLVLGGCVALLLLPHLTILWLSFVDHRQWHTELVPAHFTLAHYITLLHDPQSFAPIRNSLWMSAAAAALTLAIALPASYLTGRRRPGGRFVNVLVMLPWALPGTVIAMNLIVAFNDPWLPLYNTLWLLPLAYCVRGIPLLTRMATAAVEPFDARLMEAGRSLGASRMYCLSHIAIPLLAPALLAATALVFVTSLGDFVTSILLYMPGNLPIAIKINMEWRGSVGSAFAYSVLLMILAAVTFYASRRATGRSLGA